MNAHTKRMQQVYRMVKRCLDRQEDGNILLTLIAVSTDKELTKFHDEYMEGLDLKERFEELTL